MFDVARESDKCIIFFDEIDALCSSGKDADSNLVQLGGELLTQMDGPSGVNNNTIVIMGATNKPWDLSGAYNRRFPVTLFKNKIRS